MKLFFKVLIFLFVSGLTAQTDYSRDWKDFFSYNKVVDFVKQDDVIYAITANAAFIYNISTNEVSKFSTVNGLSGNTTSSIHYHQGTKKVVIGYENGLMEIIDEDGNVKKVVDILLSNIATDKNINSIYGSGDNLYLSMGFGIVVYNMEDLEFEDTFFIGANSSDVFVNDIVISGGYIYAASEDGVYIADYASNLSNPVNWVKNFSGDFSGLISFDNEVVAVKDRQVSLIKNNNTLELKLTLSSNVLDLYANVANISFVTEKQGFVYDTLYNLVFSTTSSDVTLSSVVYEGENLFLGSNERGVLRSTNIAPNDFIEIHPDGPTSNDLFSISVKDNHIWCVYGGYFPWYQPLQFRSSLDHFNGDHWVEIPFSEHNSEDLVFVNFDPNDINKVYVSSYGQGRGNPNSTDKGGILILKNDKFFDFWNPVNSGLSNFSPVTDPTYTTTRIHNTVFDENGDLWITNAFVTDGSGALKRYSSQGNWSGFELENNNLNYNDINIDLNNNKWIGSRRNGVFVQGDDEGESINLTSLNDGLPTDNVRAVAVGIDNNVWIGTLQGLVLFSDVDRIFSGSFRPAAPVIIDGPDGASELLDNARINDILVDGAGNVWFATESGGVLQTNATGKNTLLGFNTDNSPLPSNKVLSLSMDEKNETIYFGTEKGIVAYKTGVASYGDELSEIYAYPNPVLKQHNQISITGKNSNIPQGTNIKILDVSGNLVFESNAIETQSTTGGKFVWNKRNLSGRKVASGIYIVLMFNSEGKQTSSTKIAIIN
ncbi:type IX secretion system anionic LPS delivery protein PorZ [Flavicella marina]|uniref:type IX secretion system anionic LPS delivery protein PorZ n=1 Tax=Flavicella marina TaxID=1475951 RepID=UPI0012652449|nr:T9SS type A sorting domain-containing protein [Flavicella marina]